MFLKSLKIENDSILIRDISFRKGVNLIVDETKTNNKKESGNNVGKTTVLRLIDFCFGSDGKNIYQDPEFRDKKNVKIEQFLTQNNVVITLILKDDLDLPDSKELKIKRNFQQKEKKILEINDEVVLTKDFQKLLKEKVFNSTAEKPTFRQIISKNIRDEKNRLVNTVKVLHPSTKHEEYEALYLFWLGIDLNVSEHKQRLISQKKIEESLQKRLKKESTLSQVKQSLLVINRAIGELERKKDSLNINENFEGDIQNLNNIKTEINRTSTRLSRLELRKELIDESLQELDQELSNINVDKIKKLYTEAKVLVPSIQKTFEETLLFHNGMILEKKKYISKELPTLNAELSRLRTKLSDLLIEEKELTDTLHKSGAMEDFKRIILDLNQLYENKGAIEEQKRLWESSIEKLNTINNGLKKIDDGIDSLDNIIQRRVSEFNEHFSVISDRLYGEKFVLSADKNEKGYELNITTLIGNPGTGKKKGEMAAFDLAYIQFADKSGIECLHFVLQDQIENIHDNQITSIFTEIVEKTNCQYVLSVLRDKLPEDIDVSKYEILSLSQEEKLFKI